MKLKVFYIIVTHSLKENRWIFYLVLLTVYTVNLATSCSYRFIYRIYHLFINLDCEVMWTSLQKGRMGTKGLVYSKYNQIVDCDLKKRQPPKNS